MPRLVPALVAFATVCHLSYAAAQAAEGEVRVADVRVAVGVGPMPDEQDGTVTVPAAQSGTNLDQRYDPTVGLSVVIGGRYGRLSPFGVLIGGELRSITGEMAYESLSFAGTDYSADQLEANSGDKLPGMSFSQTGVALNLGVGWAVSPSWHVELLGIAGLDWTTWDGLANAFAADFKVQEGNGWGYTFGGRLGVYWTDRDTGWQFGLEGEYTRTETEFEISYIDVTASSDIENAGGSLRAVIGHRF